MASWDQGAGWRMCGAVVRKWISPTGKFASLTIGVPGNKGEIKHEVRAFSSSGLIDEINDLGVGQIVKVTGGVDREPLTDKARKEVKVDGYVVWVTKLTLKTLEIEGASRRPSPGPDTGPAPAGDPPPPADDNYGFR